MSGILYNQDMAKSAKITTLHTAAELQRIARGAFVKEALREDGRSGRYTAAQIGISHSALSERFNGNAPFLADELEQIARVLKVDPVAFYSSYISAGNSDEPAPKKANALGTIHNMRPSNPLVALHATVTDLGTYRNQRALA